MQFKFLYAGKLVSLFYKVSVTYENEFLENLFSFVFVFACINEKINEF